MTQLNKIDLMTRLNDEPKINFDWIKNHAHSELKSIAICYAQSHKGKLPLLAEQTGLEYEWLRKFVRDEIGDPGVLKIEKLLGHQQITGA